MARPRTPLYGVRRAGGIAGVAASCLAGCQGDVVNLGNSAPLVAGGDSGSAGFTGAGGAPGGSGGAEWLPSQEPVLIEAGFSLANPTFPSGTDYLLFTRQERGADASEVWRAERAGDDFILPDFKNEQAIQVLGDNAYGISSPALSSTGTDLWLGLFSGDSLTDIYVTRRAGDSWNTPQVVAELNSPADDAPRPPGLDGLVMPLSSRRHGGAFFQIYFAQRESLGAPWGTPNQDYLATVNSEDTTSVDGFLTDDGLSLYFAATREDPRASDLYRARRSDVRSPFADPELLEGLQHSADERDPWLSSDGWLYYSSNRSGLYAIYRARRATP